jgi:predicted MFS family arabinose efflux permease
LASARDRVGLLAFAAGLAVASNYYVQPLIPRIAGDLGIDGHSGGLLVTVSQAGYLIGLVLFVPLGELVDRRRLAPGLMAVTGAGLLAAAAASGPYWMGACLLACGATSVVTQVLVTVAADTAQPERRGRTIGAVASGAVLGVLLARTIAGALAEVVGWRGVYATAGFLVLATALVLWRRLPPLAVSPGTGYLGQLASGASLLRSSGVLRRACLYGALTFAAFSVLWSTLALMLAGPPYGFSEGVIGLFGLAAAGGALGARTGGGLFDRGHGPTVTIAALGLGAAAFALVAAGRSSLAALVIGVLAIDLACQLVQITNQGTIFELHDQRSRLTSVYMTSRFAGGAAGSAVGTALFAGFGWVASSLAGSALFATALVVCVASARERDPDPGLLRPSGWRRAVRARGRSSAGRRSSSRR